jgi:Tol biopolymer transport system component
MLTQHTLGGTGKARHAGYLGTAAVLLTIAAACGSSTGETTSSIRTSNSAEPTSIEGATTQPIISESPATSTPGVTSAPETSGDVALEAGSPWVAFTGMAADGRGAIFLVQPDGSGLHQIGADLPGEQVHADWSPDGTRIVFVDRNPDEAIWIMDSDGTDAHEIVPAEQCCGQDHPYWSPDGNRISFMRWSGPATSFTAQIEDYHLDDSSLHTLASVPFPLNPDHPRWSPDGSTLAVEVAKITPDGSAAEGGSIGLVSSATGELTILTGFDQYFGAPDWRADGKALVFDSFGLSFDETTPTGHATNIYTMNVDGTGLTQLTHNQPADHRATQPVWRADGTIAYIDTEINRSLNRFLKYMAADGQQLPDPATPIRATHPRFRPGT